MPSLYINGDFLMELLELKYAELAKKLKTKVCDTEHLLVRPYQDSDADGLFELFHDKNTMRMDGDLPIMEKNEEFVRRINFVKEGPLIWFFSEERESRDFVGYVMLQDEGDAIALGFAITVGKQHHGYGYEMLKAVIDTLFDNNVKEIRLKTWEMNLPCQKLAEKLGFEKVDVIKGDHKDSFTGEISDCFLYSLTNSFI